MIPLDERLTASDENPAQQVARRFSRRRLRAAIRRLTEGQQEVLALRFGQHLTSREVAEIMDKSISAVEALQHRALVALRRMLERENDG
jgi:RNA polymerase sigma-70 factor (ECF subfamily)